ncbi:BRCA1-associated protein [Triticum urartu]|uniref:BRCA1-associated protein n=1 Tax=Triticum urartu TaxID=4572 RepID=M8A982_TRIUA|nr:BRCA1-associated protein [Triticum urartu]
MTYADFCRFCGSFVPHMLEMRIVRIDGAEDQYSVLIKFDTLSSTDSFYKHFNGKQFSSLEGDVSRVRFVEDVHYTQLIEHAHSSITSSAEQPTCPSDLTKILEAFLLQYATILSTVHAYQNGQTLRAQYCQQQPEKSMCSVCGTSENLWICLICGNVGCGRYKGGHAIEHWKETEHCYSLELETQKVWDYAGDNYVHRLIQSKTDGKLVEYNCYGGHEADGICSICSGDAGMDEALLNSKVEAVIYTTLIVEEYNDLLTSQLDKQRNYYESLLSEVKEENEKEISAATSKAVSMMKLQKLQAKLDKCLEEKSFLDDINANLVKNQEMWKERVRKVQEREQAALKLKDEKIEKLEAELRDLIAHIECQNAVAAAPGSISSDIQGGTILPGPSTPSSSSSPVRPTKDRKRN